MTTDVVIPTHNRWASLERTVASLASDIGGAQDVRILVVDDGSTEPPPRPIALRHSQTLGAKPNANVEVMSQPNQGDAIARNTGALASSADNLIFVDDDITVHSGFVGAMTAALQVPGVIVVGALDPDTVHRVHWPEGQPILHDALPGDCEALPFTACLSGFMGVRRRDFVELGMMQPVTTQGSSVWCDVDFAYRAHSAGYRFALCRAARGIHHDEVRHDLSAQRQRSFRVGREAVVLLQRYPELLDYLPMLADKTPPEPDRDALPVRARKALRHTASTGPAVRVLELLEGPSRHLGASAEAAVRRWLIGAELYRGFAEGLGVYGPIGTSPERAG